MRRALLSVAVAVAGAGVVVATAWSVQTVGLPSPERPDRIAADATRWLAEHRVIIDVFHLDRRRLSGICLSGWFPTGHGAAAQGSLLALRSRAQYLVADHKVRKESGFLRRAVFPHLAAAVGCGRNIEQALLPGEQALLDLRADRAFAAGRPAIALRLHYGQHGRFTLFVAAQTYEPLVAILHTRRETVTARLFLADRSSALLGRFGVARAEMR